MLTRKAMPDNHLPAGFTIRPAKMDNAPEVTELMRAVDLALSGKSDVDEEDIRSDWQTASFNLETDTWVVLAPPPSGQAQQILVGYAELWNRSQHAYLAGDGYVHPAYLGLGIGSALMRQVENRARQHIPLAPPETRVFIRSGAYGHDQAAIHLFEQHGYTPARYFWRMQIDLAAPPPAAALPEGCRLHKLSEVGPDIEPVQRQIFETLEEAFRDHWGYSPWDYADWRNHHVENASFDPSLWYWIEADGQIAAAAVNRLRSGSGWVSSLGVRQPWRRQGLALALLHLAFADFYQRGISRIALGVDASSPTGATRLYEHAGMRMVEQYIAFEKELRSGETIKS
jgi:mycothiol synthase